MSLMRILQLVPLGYLVIGTVIAVHALRRHGPGDTWTDVWDDPPRLLPTRPTAPTTYYQCTDPVTRRAAEASHATAALFACSCGTARIPAIGVAVHHDTAACPIECWSLTGVCDCGTWVRRTTDPIGAAILIRSGAIDVTALRKAWKETR